jgi:hypothetical protein
MAKVPLLFLLTLMVTLPSLYVFSALANSRLHFVDTLTLLLAATAVNLALLASCGPVTGFFTKKKRASRRPRPGSADPRRPSGATAGSSPCGR